MTSPPLRVVIADDHPTFRDGLRAVLARAPDLVIVGEASSGEEALAAVAAKSPDVVVMDVMMPGIGGVEATRRLVADRPGIGVLVLTMSDADETVYAALRAGARGYLLKDVDAPDLVAAVRAVAAGQALFGPAVAARISTFFAAGVAARPFPELSEREREVLELMARGLDNAGIAHRLHLAPKTVRNHVSAVLVKLHAAGRAQAVAQARDAGLGNND